MKLTELSLEEQGKLIHEFQVTMETAFNTVDNAWLVIGDQWAWAVDNKLWKIWGNDAVYNASKLAKELNQGSRSSLDQKARLARMFGQYIRSENLNPRLSKLLPVHTYIMQRIFEDEEERERVIKAWVYKADVESLQQILDDIREEKKLITSEMCLHPTEKRVTFQKCGICKKQLGKVERV